MKKKRVSANDRKKIGEDFRFQYLIGVEDPNPSNQHRINNYHNNHYMLRRLSVLPRDVFTKEKGLAQLL